MSDQRPTTPLRARVVAALPAAIVALVCAASAIHTESTRADPVSNRDRPSPTLSPEASELLDGLAVGERIAGWNVIALSGPTDHAIAIGFERDAQRFVVTIAAMGLRPEHPAVQTERYAIYYGHATPPDRKIPDGAVRAITAGLARRIAKHEHELPEL